MNRKSFALWLALGCVLPGCSDRWTPIGHGDGEADLVVDAETMAADSDSTRPAGPPPGGFGGPPGRFGPGNFDPAAYFDRRDADGDGKLTGDEISERLRGRLEEIDIDKDGAVTLEEYEQGFRAGSRGGPGGGPPGAFGGPGGFGRNPREGRPDRPQRPELEPLDEKGS